MDTYAQYGGQVTDPATGIVYDVYYDSLTGERYEVQASGYEDAYFTFGLGTGTAAPTNNLAGIPVTVYNPDGTPGTYPDGTLIPPVTTSFITNGNILQIQDPETGLYVTPNATAQPTAVAPAAADTYGGGGGTSGGSDTYLAWDEGSGTYYSKRRSSGGYSSGGYSSGGGSTPAAPDPMNSFPFADGFGNSDGDPTPVYANGTVHPFFGGSMPGGTGDGIGGPATQVTVPSTGASAGPYGVTAPRSYTASGGGAAPAAGGSTGGNSTYWDARNNILGGMFGGGTTTEDTGTTEAEWRKSQNQADARYKQDQNQAQAEAEKQSQFYNLYSNPQWQLTGAYGNQSPGSPGYNQQSSMPAAQLALMTEGYKGNDTFTKKPNTFSRTLSDLYGDIQGGQNFDYNTLMGNLFGASNKSSLGRLFMEEKPGEAKYNKDGLYKRTTDGDWKNASASSQTSTMMSMLNAAYGTTMNPQMAAAYSARAAQAMDAYGTQNWDRKNPQSILDYMGSYLGY